MASAALATAQEALKVATTAVNEGRIHAAACAVQWAAANETLSSLKDGQIRAFWWMIGLLGGTCSMVVLALGAVLMHALIKANVL